MDPVCIISLTSSAVIKRAIGKVHAFVSSSDPLITDQSLFLCPFLVSDVTDTIVSVLIIKIFL